MIWVGRGAALIAVVLWAQAYHWSKVVLTWLDPIVASEARFSIAAVVLIAIACCLGRPVTTFRSAPLAYLALGLVGIAGFQVLLFLGLTRTSAVNAAAVMALTPLLTAVAAWALLDQAIGPRMALGLLISAVGAALVVFAGARDDAIFSVGWGEISVLGASACLALYSVGLRRRGDAASALMNTAIVVLIGAIFMLPMLIFATVPGPPVSFDPVSALLWLALGSTVAGYFLWARALGMVGVAECGLFYNFIPVITLGLAALGGEIPGVGQLAGAAFVIVGAVITMVPARDRAVTALKRS